MQRHPLTLSFISPHQCFSSSPSNTLSIRYLMLHLLINMKLLSQPLLPLAVVAVAVASALTTRIMRPSSMLCRRWEQSLWYYHIFCRHAIIWCNLHILVTTYPIIPTPHPHILSLINRHYLYFYHQCHTHGTHSHSHPQVTYYFNLCRAVRSKDLPYACRITTGYDGEKCKDDAMAYQYTILPKALYDDDHRHVKTRVSRHRCWFVVCFSDWLIGWLIVYSYAHKSCSPSSLLLSRSPSLRTYL